MALANSDLRIHGQAIAPSGAIYVRFVATAPAGAIVRDGIAYSAQGVLYVVQDT